MSRRSSPDWRFQRRIWPRRADGESTVNREVVDGRSRRSDQHCWKALSKRCRTHLKPGESSQNYARERHDKYTTRAIHADIGRNESIQCAAEMGIVRSASEMRFERTYSEVGAARNEQDMKGRSGRIKFCSCLQLLPTVKLNANSCNIFISTRFPCELVTKSESQTLFHVHYCYPDHFPDYPRSHSDFRRKLQLTTLLYPPAYFFHWFDHPLNLIFWFFGSSSASSPSSAPGPSIYLCLFHSLYGRHGAQVAAEDPPANEVEVL